MINLSKKRNQKNEQNVFLIDIHRKELNSNSLWNEKLNRFFKSDQPPYEINSIIKKYIRNSINKYRQVDSNKNK